MLASRSHRLTFVTLLSLLASTSLFAEFAETFDRFPAGRSLYKLNSDWKKFNSGDQAQPSANTAILRRDSGKSYLTLTAFGHKTANARIYQKIHLPVSASSNHRFAVEIRPNTPGTDDANFGGAVFSIAATRDGEYDPEGRFLMGFVREEGQMVFSFLAGDGDRVHSRAGEINIDPHKWYLFEAELEPASGRVEVVVYALDGDERQRVWSGNNEGLPPWKPEVISQINLMVTRPGTLEEKSHSADFSNISITP